MAKLIFFVLLSGKAWAGTPPPYSPQNYNNSNPISAMNSNLIDITGRNKDNLVPVVGDVDCSNVTNGALIGATEKGGYIYGGSCVAPMLVNSTDTVSGAKTFDGPTNFTGSIISTETIFTSDYTTAVTASNNGISTNTVTLTTSTHICISGTNMVIGNDTTNNGANLGILIDGANPDGHAQNIVATEINQTGGGDNVMSENFFYKTIRALATGTHSIALTFLRAGPSGTAHFSCSSHNNCRIYIDNCIP